MGRNVGSSGSREQTLADRRQGNGDPVSTTKNRILPVTTELGKGSLSPNEIPCF